MKSERDGINPAAEPSGTGCVECLAFGGWWFHLRRCAECGCCDSSPISMHRNITQLRVIRLSRASGRASGGFTIIVQGNSSLARSFPLHTRIRWINRRPARRERCLQIGKRCFTNRMPRNPFLGAVKLGVRGGSFAASLYVQSR
jgi:hypothetical protein